MESGERKNIQARQSSDGTFELFVGQGGLEEISEEEVSVAEIVPAVAKPLLTEKKSPVPLVAFSLSALVLLSVGGFFIFANDESKEEPIITEVQGFRAYQGSAPARKATPKPRKAAVSKSVKKAEPVAEKTDKENKDIAWDENEEPTPVNDIEARIQPNRNPSPESVEIVIHDESDPDEIDDNNDDSKEIAAQKRLGLLPTKLPAMKNNPVKGIKKIQPNLTGKDLPNLGGIRNLQKRIPKEEVEGD